MKIDIKGVEEQLVKQLMLDKERFPTAKSVVLKAIKNLFDEVSEEDIEKADFSYRNDNYQNTHMEVSPENNKDEDSEQAANY